VLAFGSLAFVLVLFASAFRTPPGAGSARGQLPGAWDTRPTPAGHP
jgi:hypothetical protein